MRTKQACSRVAPGDPLGVSAADVLPALEPARIPAERVIEIWNGVAEDHGPLTGVILQFAAKLEQEFERAEKRETFNG